MKSDLERHNLRGPVKTAFSETVQLEEQGGEFIEKAWHSKRVTFDADGKLTEQCDINAYGSTWRRVPAYAADGKLSEIASHNPDGSFNSKHIYGYDAEGRMTEEVLENADGTARRMKTYTYDAGGRKTEQYELDYSFDSYAEGEGGSEGEGGGRAESASRAARRRDFMIGVEGSDHSYSAGGARLIRIIYNDEDRAVEIQAYDGEGLLVQKIVYVYDGAGNLVEETQRGGAGLRFQRPPGVSLSEEDEAEIAKLFGEGVVISQTLTTYDERGRRIDTTGTMAGMFMGRRTFAYDDHDDVTEDANFNEDGTLQSKAIFTREYDERGNWTEEIVSGASTWDVEFGTSIPRHRTRRVITYH